MDGDIVYHFENPQQFWSELEDTLRISPSSPLAKLDGTLHRFVVLCSTFHEQFLQAPIQLEHACLMLINSDLFDFHSERLTDLLILEATSNTNPHVQLIAHHLLLFYGLRQPPFLRSRRKWKEVIPILMDHLLVEVDPETEDWGSTAGSSHGHGYSRLGTPIETKLRLLAVQTLYEICRVQKFDLNDLAMFDDRFLDTLFDLVEQTRSMQDDTLNYGIIKVIVALNEQFMLASLPATSSRHGGGQHLVPHDNSSTSHNRVLSVLIRRLNSCKTFGENMIFMLNRADSSSPDDLCVQLLILKFLYLLFTNQSTREYFYLNDLLVLVDVFLRELSNLDDEHDSLRHTYLRVLHPLLTNTQLKNAPYKGAQILRTLEALVDKADIRVVSSTTKRLVERCLSGEWCVKLRKQGGMSSPTSSTGTEMSSSFSTHGGSASNGGYGHTKRKSMGGGLKESQVLISTATVPSPLVSGAGAFGSIATGSPRTLKSSRSVGDLKKPPPMALHNAPPLPSAPVRKHTGSNGLYDELGSGGYRSSKPTKSNSDPHKLASQGSGSNLPSIQINPNTGSGASSPTSPISPDRYTSPHLNRIQAPVTYHSAASLDSSLPTSKHHPAPHSLSPSPTPTSGSNSSVGSSTAQIGAGGMGGDQPKRRKPPPIPNRSLKMKPATINTLTSRFATMGSR